MSAIVIKHMHIVQLKHYIKIVEEGNKTHYRFRGFTTEKHEKMLKDLQNELEKRNAKH